MSEQAAPEPAASGQSASRAPTTVLRVSPTALLAALFALVCLSPALLARPAWFGWLAVLPVLYAGWALRVRTTADATGLRVRRLWTSRAVTWEQLRGVRFPRRRTGGLGGHGVAVLSDSSELPLPCVTFRDLPTLSAASGGRLPDPFAAERDE